jgi:hypothetical protein
MILPRTPGPGSQLSEFAVHSGGCPSTPATAEHGLTREPHTALKIFESTLGAPSGDDGIHQAEAKVALIGLGRTDHRTSFREFSLTLTFTDAEFDAVTNVYGLMFCPDVRSETG